MASSLYTVIILLWTLQDGGTLHVYNDRLIKIAFANEEINAICKTNIMYKPDYTKFILSYYRIDSESKEITVMQSLQSVEIPPGRENKSETLIYPFKIKPFMHSSVSGTYYCKALWILKNQVRRGNGTFILFREKGYTEPPLTMWVCLITITIILTVASIMGTVLLFWKREWRQIKKCPAQRPAPPHTSGSSEPPEPSYVELGPREPDVYFAINKSTDSPLHKKVPAVKVSRQITQEITDVYENNTADLYENI
uniref:NFAT activation molecule 1 n=1 Tax=Podarcis muralis TaxID=64176 RepID=UPI0010A07539|nr:NFAT activation molecule 1 [Podarcis muralis]